MTGLPWPPGVQLVVLAVLAATAVLVGGVPRLPGRPGRPGATEPSRADRTPPLLRRPRSLLPRLALRSLGRDRAGVEAAAEELEVVDTVAAALEGGLPVSRAVGLALERARPAPRKGGPEWAVVARAAREGEPLAPAWDRVARRAGTPTLGAVARSWQVASRSGAPLAEALRVSAHTARERRRLENAVEAASAGARATATVLTCLPLAGIALAAVLGVPPTVLYATPTAWACLAAGATLLLLGQVLVRRLVADVLRSAR
ncbi:type II secretion system F family protein [uncultured Serinicoccus sp.]|uniref:type II secretion system F family protein n=1 Tax=uncultured Serinicoccus sp. TaxID=735514 RepID=UPI0026215CD7|nr:type II secretion system F family protein [uncultured Serinicoccus sp.]